MKQVYESGPTFLLLCFEIHMELRNNNTRAYMPLIYALLLVFGLLLGFIVAQVSANKRQPLLQTGHYDKLEDILAFIKARYVDTVNTTQLTDEAIEKLLSTLDPHSTYIPAREISSVNESLEGNFDGIGVEFFIVQDTIHVVSAVAGGPAELVGVQAGDRIITIEDTIVAGKHIKNDEVLHKLRGKGGSKVRVGILRAGDSALKSVTITRDKIPLYSMDAAYMMGEGIGYIKINRFSETTSREFRKKLRELNEKGLKQLIIDLRQNPGGYLNAATEMLDELIAGEKLLVYTKGNAVNKMEYRSGLPGEFERGSLAVLIDQGSASAAEIVSGAVQDLDRGVVVGRTSFGKGLVQEQYPLQDGSALRLTVARYYTPSGRCIQRSYKGGNEDYFNEVYERYNKGEFVHEDTLSAADTTVYHTANGRKVYGGGGIRPDVFVPLDTSEDYDYVFKIRLLIPEVVYGYFSAHPDQLKPYSDPAAFNRGFVVPDELLHLLMAQAEKAHVKGNLAKAGRSNAIINQYVKAYMAKQKWRTDGFYYVLNEGDPVITAALKSFGK
ncbi:MAG: S41 family peptidase [Chitinophagales bacterium]